MTGSYAEGRAIARRGEGNKVTDDLELEQASNDGDSTAPKEKGGG